MAKNNNKINKNTITKEQHKTQNLVFIGLVLTIILMALISFYKATLRAVFIILAIILLISFIILFYFTPKNPEFRRRYLSIQCVFFLAMCASSLSVFLTPASTLHVGESLVVATSISILIDIEFYKHMKGYILKMLKDQKTKRGLWLLKTIDMTFGPMIASILALFLALVALMTFLFPYSILFIDMSILLIFFALVMPIELFVEDLLTQAHYPESLKERK